MCVTRTWYACMVCGVVCACVGMSCVGVSRVGVCKYKYVFTMYYFNYLLMCLFTI